jgi:HAD superfamily hydrolase (TIGR01458 family)
VIDLDGTLYVGNQAVPGAAAAVTALRTAGVPLCFATNTTRRPRSALVERLAAMGIEIDAAELHTAPVAASRWLAAEGVQRVSLLLAEATFEEFAGFEGDDRQPEAVVVGDLGEAWTFERLNRAFLALQAGARLVAIHKNRFWDPGCGPRLDAGPFVAALEYAAGCQAVLVGKPSAAFYRTAAASLGLPLEQVAAVGDNVENDVFGAQAAGCRGIAVRTGSFCQELLDGAQRQPDVVLDSIADLPGWLGVGRKT